MNIILILAAVVVIVHCTCIIAKLSPRNWSGHRLEFIGLSLAYSFMAGGAVGTALGWHYGPVILLLASAGKVLFDRRNRTS